MPPALYLEAWGKPVAFYSDKHGVFRVNHPGALGGDGKTQFGRALHALNIDITCANSSPAKGRVERGAAELGLRRIEGGSCHQGRVVHNVVLRKILILHLPSAQQSFENKNL
jgi:hypothetical protein